MKWIKSTLVFAVMLMTAQMVYGMDRTESDVRTVEITGTDNMRFSVEEIEASPGETIRLVFKVVSNIPPAAMQHNVVILDQGVDVDGFVETSISARDNEYIDPEKEDQVIANTNMIGGGETSEIEFTVPETPGEYTYVCTFPGHYQAGMVGVLRVTS